MSIEFDPAGETGNINRVPVRVSPVRGGMAPASVKNFPVRNAPVMRKAPDSPIIGTMDISIPPPVMTVALLVPLGAHHGAHPGNWVPESRMSAGFARWLMIFVKLPGVAPPDTTARRFRHVGQSAERFGKTTRQSPVSHESLPCLPAVFVVVHPAVLPLDIRRIPRLQKVVKPKNCGDHP